MHGLGVEGCDVPRCGVPRCDAESNKPGSQTSGGTPIIGAQVGISTNKEVCFWEQVDVEWLLMELILRNWLLIDWLLVNWLTRRLSKLA